MNVFYRFSDKCPGRTAIHCLNAGYGAKIQHISDKRPKSYIFVIVKPQMYYQTLTRVCRIIGAKRVSSLCKHSKYQ
ncbi:hypothetical protein HMPREF0663_10383 [Hoylesella oralis ATCC 33269]|uniref:Uncharacterized protein n=1 Tax=Hoylesella oralis ATCC 33269 TaxID=873533 RepID=E7RMN3_9BACT|nr:hypothetical protein HMPREF0663_10383 [Hoylesella oralis ATCC 33269]